MPQQNSILAAAAVMALMPLLTLNAMAREPGPPIQLAMMDMMPMAPGGATQQPAPDGAMPGMTDMRPMESGNAMPMQQPAPGGIMPGMSPTAGGSMGGGMPAQSQMPQQPMPMCSMMQNMMRMGAVQQAMPMTQNGSTPGAMMDMGDMADAVHDAPALAVAGPVAIGMWMSRLGKWRSWGPHRIAANSPSGSRGAP